MFQQITILAPGLLGASIAKSLKDSGDSARRVIWARRTETREELAEADWCDQVANDPREAVADADLVVLCSPVDVIQNMVRELSDAFKPGAVVTDVGSVKGDICRVGREAAGTRFTFIGSHPMAGSERTGHKNARADLFRGRVCVITPWPEDPEENILPVVRFWRGLGMNVVRLTPDIHDEQVAAVSHLPHLLASALAHYLQLQHPDAARVSGQGLRDTTRIAAGDPDLWTAIFESNRDEILRTLDGAQEELEQWRIALHNRQWADIRRFLAVGKKFRDSLD